MKRSWCWIVAGGAVLVSVLFTSCGSERPAMHVKVGVPPLEQNALLYVSMSRDFLQRNGIHLVLKNYDSGPSSLSALASGEVNIAETAEFPFVEAVMHGASIRIIATNDRFENDYLVARVDRGIGRVAELKGKRIGVARHTIAEFYLGRFLRLHGIPLQDVTVVNVRPPEFVRSLTDGKVDAVVAWQPFVSRMTSRRTGAFKVWSVQSSQPVYGVLVSREAWIVAHRAAVNAFLTSLSQAQDFIIGHKRESEKIVARRLGYRDSYLSSVWGDHQFTLSLDFSLVAAMEDEARWAMASHLAKGPEVPDFGKFVDRRNLDSVRPYSVNMMR